MTGAVVAGALGLAVLLGVLGWRLPPTGRLAVSGGLLGLLGTAALVLAVSPVDGAGEVAVVVSLAGALAVAGGGVLTAAVFALVDHGTAASDGSISRAGEVLRGGAWIGGLERAAVFTTLLADWPEGLAVTLALKGLGRYPELRTETPGAAERFIIGTFTSVLWAVACAALAALAVG
ncbi:hypothetical protein [Nocardioides donggukensis]|uniref:Uncharacterized protein n=1 Tax=Nocardioides donggukensis TaxID=2774019 RepID=A0A927Q138_9ACTN|nr:hypothetical protein [Nocardioides donggukensis]MBD8869099.1 hypothetical protein [Nocardioides donggukensis]